MNICASAIAFVVFLAVVLFFDEKPKEEPRLEKYQEPGQSIDLEGSKLERQDTLESIKPILNEPSMGEQFKACMYD